MKKIFLSVVCAMSAFCMTANATTVNQSADETTTAATANQSEAPDAGLDHECGVFPGDAIWTYADGVLTITVKDVIADFEDAEEPGTQERHQFAPWYSIKDLITKVKIVNNGRINKLGDYAFANCENLTTVEIEDFSGPVRLGIGTFSNCKKLTNVYFNNNIVSFNVLSFKNCTSLKTLYVKQVESMDWPPFMGCGALSLYMLKEPTVGFHEDALPEGSTIYAPFVDQHRWQYVNSNKVKMDFFVYNNTAKTITGSNDVTYGNVTLLEDGLSIGDNSSVSYSDVDLTYPVIDGCGNELHITQIAKNAFIDNTNITSVKLPASLKTIGDYAFENERNLASVTLNEGLDSLGIGAFHICHSLSSLTLPSTLRSVGDEALLCGDKTTDFVFKSLPHFNPTDKTMDKANSIAVELTDSSYVNTDSKEVFSNVASASYTRAANDFTMATIVLPFDAESDENVQFYTVTGLNGNIPVMEKRETLPAGTPAVAVKKAGEGINITSENVAVGTELNDVTGNVTMKGSFADNVQIIDPDSYYLKGTKFMLCNNCFYIYKFRAYVVKDTNKSAGAKAAVCSFDDDSATSIDTIAFDSVEVKIQSIHDESGAVRSDFGKGLNIVKYTNGQTKKIFVK